MDSQGKLGPALWGGLFIGLVSGIPVLNFINCACCAGVIGGGMLAVYLFKNRQAPEDVVSMQDGAILGLMAGVIGAVIGTILSSMFGAMSFNFLDTISRYVEDQELQDAIAEMHRGAFKGGFFAIGFVVSLVVNSVFGLVGGLLGSAVFGKAKMV